MARNSRKQEVVRDWYSISASSALRFVALLAVVAGFLLFQYLESRSLRDRAEAAISEASDLARMMERREDYQQARIEHFAAWDDLDAARADFDGERYREALDRARRAGSKLQDVLEAAQGPSEGKSRFIRVQGGVEYRRGERGTWKRARNQDALNPGDWVKTSADGTAEIRFPDGTKYVLRRNSMVRLDISRGGLLGGEVQTTSVVFGRVELKTTQSDSKLKTEQSEVKVRRDSEAVVDITRDQGASRFQIHGGSAEVTSKSGQIQELRAFQQVEQVGDRLSAPKAIPGKPQLLQPANDDQIDLAAQRLQLTWNPVRNARSYELNISRSPLFATNLITDDKRRKTSARLGLRGEGVFYWQVAAVDADGTRGPWSETRSFRVAALRQPGAGEDDVPPELELADIQTYGRLVIVNGRTEPGAAVTINDEAASVQTDGSFNKTIHLSQVGFAFIRVVATDAWDNPTEVQRRVFIDAL